MKKFLLSILLLFSLPVSAKKIHIVVLDSGLPKFGTNTKVCKDGVVDLTNTDVYDKMQHGTNILGIISNRLQNIDYCVYVLKVYTGKINDSSKFSYYLKSLMYIYYLNDVDIVNFSSAGTNFDPVELALIEGLIYKKVKFVASAGNDRMNLDKKCNYYPACYKNVISVGSGKSTTEKNSYSNYGKVVTEWRDGSNVCANGICMTGTSQAAAIYTSDLAIKLYDESIRNESN